MVKINKNNTLVSYSNMINNHLLDSLDISEVKLLNKYSEILEEDKSPIYKNTSIVMLLVLLLHLMLEYI